MARLEPLQGQTFDVVVIGGGIIGCGAARDLAMRGLRVALFERRDFGSGTTSASTRIVHGGLRYLQTLDLRLVRMDLRERETLLRIAPHLVKPLEFLIPFLAHSATSPLTLRVGLTLYDALSPGKTLPSHRILSAAQARAADPVLQRDDVRGAAAYYDARVDLPERLAVENAIDAEARGAAVRNYCEVLPSSVAEGGTQRVRVRDTISGDEADVRARVLVNATGAWWEQMAAAQIGRRPGRIRTTKGIHIVCSHRVSHALVLFSAVDRRLMFAIPRAGHTWIGTTDTDYDRDPAAARATRDDVDYVLKSVRPIFPALRFDDVLYTTAGVRALVTERGRPSSVSRMHKIVADLPLPGMVSILGGKITGYRAIAEDAADAACRRLRISTPCRTAEEPLPGAGQLPPSSTPNAHLKFLESIYGRRAAEVVALAESEPALGRALSPEYPDIAAQVVFGVRHEHCLHVSDFIRRRSLLGASSDQGAAAAASVAALMAAELRWPPARAAREIDDYERDVAATRAFGERS